MSDVREIIVFIPTYNERENVREAIYGHLDFGP